MKLEAHHSQRSVDCFKITSTNKNQILSGYSADAESDTENASQKDSFESVEFIMTPKEFD